MFINPSAAALWMALATTAPLSPAPADSAEPRVSGAEIARGCAACHALTPEAPDGWGPRLHDLLGRPVGAQTSYRYGSYLRAEHAKGATWTEDRLRSWLADSKAVARAADARTKMPAQGLSEAQVEALIEFLKAGE